MKAATVGSQSVNNQPALSKALLESTRAMDLDLSGAACDKLLAYQKLLLRWNKVFNLTAIRDSETALTHHLLDSLAVAVPLIEYVENTGRIVDVGSGAGLPGIPLAILWPNSQIHLIEPVGKKAAFLTQCRAELDLKNLHVHPNRVEELQPKAFGAVPDIIICRAFTALGRFVELVEPLCGPSTWIAAMKAAKWQQECEAYTAESAQAAAMTRKNLAVGNEFTAPYALAKTCLLDVPGVNATRALILLRRGAPGDPPPDGQPATSS